MNELIWTLFVQTGNIETYLLLKQIENEQGELSGQEIEKVTQENS